MRSDGELRKLAIVPILFGSSMTIFPHYQALARDRLQLSFDSLATWVIVQNIGTGVFSLIVGLVADRYGNRLVLRGAMCGLTTIPFVAVFLSRSGEFGSACYWIVFVLFGLTPITIRTLQNYVLELTTEEKHPRYLSTLSLAIAFPIYFSPFFGLGIDRIGYDAPLLLVGVVVGAGWLMTFAISEPRHKTAQK